MVTVYCEMVLHDGGFTFIPKSAMKKGTLPNLLPQLFTSRNEVLLYIQNKDGSQTYTYIEQLQEQENTPLAVLQNTHSGKGSLVVAMKVGPTAHVLLIDTLAVNMA